MHSEQEPDLAEHRSHSGSQTEQSGASTPRGPVRFPTTQDWEDAHHPQRGSTVRQAEHMVASGVEGSASQSAGHDPSVSHMRLGSPEQTDSVAKGPVASPALQVPSA